ncbi:MAG: FHA domain-containing protein [Planctomycetaceae bacterium]
MIAKLIPLDGSPALLIIREVTLVGRKGGECDIALEHPSISKLHCAIARTDGLLFVRDLGSTNGTKVNGQRVTRGALLPGDELTFANIRFKVFLGPGEMPARPDDHTEVLSIADNLHDDEFPPLPVEYDDVAEDGVHDVRLSDSGARSH